MRNVKGNTSLADKVIVITGATSGVGRAAALAFAGQQSTMVLAARRLAVLIEIAEECEALGATVLTFTTDVTDKDEVNNLAIQAASTFGKIDVWINNAGVLAAGRFEETPVEVHDKVIRTNLMGYIHGAHAVLPFFKKQGNGILINNISVGAWLPTPYATAYTASKFGLLGFTEALKAELLDWKDIHICNLFPAFLDTPGMQHAANYTGKALRPAPPVFSPERVASAMVKLVNKPKSSTSTDIAAPLLKLAYATFPALTLKITASVMESYFKKAYAMPSTSGNVLSPVKYGAAVSGGWQFLLKEKAAAKSGRSVLLLGLGVGLFLISSLRTK